MSLSKPSRTDKRKEETKNRITEVAMDLFINQGFDQTTIDQIADAADVAKGTIYNHFPEKEAILSEHIQRVINEQGPEIISNLRQLPDTKSRLIAALTKSLDWMQIDLTNDLFEKYFTYKMSKVVPALKGENTNISTGFRSVLESILEVGKESGEIRKDIDSSLLAAQLELNHIIVAVFWVMHPNMSSIYETIQTNVELFLNGAKQSNTM
ncbi:MAG: TetR/AcrR family transcriptional regulator [Chitinophagales bacterium]